jgi:gliding motility-associated-like protein
MTNSGCSDTVNVPTFIKVNNTPKADILADTTGCEDQPLLNIAAITSIDPVTYYNWQFSNGTSGNTDTINAYFATTGYYKTKLIVGTAYGCYDTVGASVVIYPTPEVVTTPDFALCKGQTAFINTTGATKYEWTPSTGLSCNTCPNSIASPIVTTNYVVAGFNSFGCADRDTLLITVPQQFTLTTSGNDTMCIGGDSLQLTTSGASNYSWSPSVGLSATDTSTPKAAPPITTSYQVIGSDNYHCFADTAYLVVAVGTYPSVTLGPELVLSTGTNVTLNPVFTYPTQTAGPISKYVWTPSTDLSCDNCPNPIATIDNDICYTLTATNIYGCSSNTDTLCVKAFCKNTQVFIANAFTPDGDGVNDKLVVQGKGIKIVKSFRIFSRWGEVVFERDNFPANDASYGWDGTIKGVPASPDVYIYTCEVMCENDVVFNYKGNTAIIK